MTKTEEKLAFYFDNLMDFAHKFSKNSNDNVLLAGAMMGAAKVLYENNLNFKQFEEIFDHNFKDLKNLLKPTIH